MEITVLCKVVDNYGDIGVAFRACKRLLEYPEISSVNLIVDNLKSFKDICDSVKIEEEFQNIEGICVYDWNAFDFCYNKFKENDGIKLSLILELFQCGRPDWMEKILFEDKLNRTVQIIMIDYLTAEDYAETFHCLQSLTRSAKVQKVNFMPGFTEKTGGLIIDKGWEELPERKKDGAILVFTYERDWRPLISAIEASNPGKKITVKVAQGRGKKSFIEAANKCRLNNTIIDELPFLNQHDWDNVMKNSSVLFVRGEESMSRACLSGIPFVWQAYPQSEEYQLVKVEALLQKIKPFFESEDYKVIERVWHNINKPETEVSYEEMESSCKDFLEKSEQLVYGYRAFASALRKNGDLINNLMTFIRKICIIA